ncbi:MAG: hypothetical protein ACPGXI_07120 [Mycobacterium sp.]
MKAKRPARGTTSGKRSQTRGGRGSAREAKRLRDAPPRRRNPTREARPQRSAPRAGPIRRPVGSPARPKSASQAKARSKARKAKAPKVVRTPLRQRILAKLAAVEVNPRALVARVPFVVLIIAALGTGLGVTLWLSTDAAERSYQLGNARQVNQDLIQQKEALERDVLEAQAAPALAEAARDLGMIPSRDTAHLVQDAAGNWVVVGTPKPAEGVSPPPLNTPLPDPVPPAPRIVEPLEVPVRISAVPGALEGPAGAAPSPALGVGSAPAAPSVVAPGVAVPHAVTDRLPTPGPVPPLPPGAPGAGLGPPTDQLGLPLEGQLGSPLDADQMPLLPEAANQQGVPSVTEQFAPVPGAPA